MAVQRIIIGRAIKAIGTATTFNRQRPCQIPSRAVVKYDGLHVLANQALIGTTRTGISRLYRDVIT
ncbi:hypothetical protein D3C77_597580 [compost metagenome]